MADGYQRYEPFLRTKESVPQDAGLPQLMRIIQEDEDKTRKMEEEKMVMLEVDSFEDPPTHPIQYERCDMSC